MTNTICANQSQFKILLVAISMKSLQICLGEIKQFTVKGKLNYWESFNFLLVSVKDWFPWIHLDIIVQKTNLKLRLLAQKMSTIMKCRLWYRSKGKQNALILTSTFNQKNAILKAKVLRFLFISVAEPVGVRTFWSEPV